MINRIRGLLSEFGIACIRAQIPSAARPVPLWRICPIGRPRHRRPAQHSHALDLRIAEDNSHIKLNDARRKLRCYKFCSRPRSGRFNGLSPVFQGEFFRRAP